MSRETIFKGHILNLVLEDAKWEIIEHKPAVGILAVQDGKMMCVRQLRRAAGVTTLEVPAGLIDAGETPIQAAAREFAEEARLAGDLELLSGFYSSPGFTDELIHLFKATNLRPAYGERDEDEAGIELVWIEPEKFLEGLKTGAIHSSGPAVVAALYAVLESRGLEKDR
jgi:ADP-ribose pyrophosphatase